MRVRVGYAYEATSGTAAGARKVVLRDEALLHVHRIEPSQAKAAFRCRGFHAVDGRRPRFREGIRSDDAATFVDTVASDGVLYEAVRIVSDYPERIERLATSSDLETPERFLSDVKWVSRLLELQDEGRKPRVPNPRTSKATYRGTDAKDAAADMGALAKSLVLVGDVLHRKVDEPVFRIANDGGLMVVQCPKYLHEGRTFFRLDESDALERTMGLLHGKAGARSAREMADKVSLDPSFRPGADIAEDCFVKAVKDLLWSSGNELPTFPLPAMEAFADLEESYRETRHDRERDAAAMGRLRGLAADFCDACDALGVAVGAVALARIQIEVFDAREASKGPTDVEDVDLLAAIAP